MVQISSVKMPPEISSKKEKTLQPSLITIGKETIGVKRMIDLEYKAD